MEKQNITIIIKSIKWLVGLHKGMSVIYHLLGTYFMIIMTIYSLLYLSGEDIIPMDLTKIYTDGVMPYIWIFLFVLYILSNLYNIIFFSFRVTKYLKGNDADLETKLKHILKGLPSDSPSTN